MHAGASASRACVGHGPRPRAPGCRAPGGGCRREQPRAARCNGPARPHTARALDRQRSAWSPSAACRWGRASRPTPNAPCEGPRLARWAACARRRLLMARASAVPCCEPRPHAPPRALPPAPRALKPRAVPSGRPCRGAQQRVYS